jgi:hypothetical protein
MAITATSGSKMAVNILQKIRRAAVTFTPRALLTIPQSTVLRDVTAETNMKNRNCGYAGKSIEKAKREK